MTEIQNFGWNTLTISSIVTVFFSLLAAWGLYDQIKQIWHNRSGKAVSSLWFICATALFASIVIYGISIKSIAVTFSGIARGPLHVPILIGLAKFKGFTKLEWYMLWFLTAAILAMVVLPGKGVFFLVLSLGVLIPTAAQPLEIWLTKSAGVVSIKMMTIYTISTSFWVIYSIAISDYFILTFSACSWLLFGLTIVLWFKFRNSP